MGAFAGPISTSGMTYESSFSNGSLSKKVLYLTVTSNGSDFMLPFLPILDMATSANRLRDAITPTVLVRYVNSDGESSESHKF
jgi:hypothetical protein